MNEEALKQAAADQGLDLSAQQLEQLAAYYQLLVEWNEKINLTAITDKDEVYLKHFYDSLTLGFYVDLTQGQSLVDVGTGAGFPGLVLKIAYPSLELTLVDSLKKRVNFLETVVEELGLTSVSVYHARAEDFGQDKRFRGQFDLATARAVAKLSVLSEYCLPLLKKGGSFLAMKGSRAQEEADEAKQAIATLGGKLVADYAFDLGAEAGERHILRIEKRKETPNKYPRRAGLPAKKPL